MELPWAVQVTVGAITVTAQATSSSDRHDKQGSGDFYLAISGDLQLATNGDFHLATDTRSAGRTSTYVGAQCRQFHSRFGKTAAKSLHTPP
jgi:hypothetical protein